MLIGIKYCGGCNPKFDRAGFVQKLKNDLGSKYDFQYVKDGILCDIILVICGCTSCCAHHENLSSKYDKLFVISDKDYPVILNKIQNINKSLGKGDICGMV